MILQRNKMHLSSNQTLLDPCKTGGGTSLWAVIEPVYCWDNLSAVLWCNLDHHYSTHFASTSTNMYLNTMAERGIAKGVSCPITEHSGPCEEPLKPRPFDLEFHALRNIYTSIYSIWKHQATTHSLYGTEFTSNTYILMKSAGSGNSIWVWVLRSIT